MAPPPMLHLYQSTLAANSKGQGCTRKAWPRKSLHTVLSVCFLPFNHDPTFFVIFCSRTRSLPQTTLLHATQPDHHVSQGSCSHCPNPTLRSGCTENGVVSTSNVAACITRGKSLDRPCLVCAGWRCYALIQQRQSAANVLR